MPGEQAIPRDNGFRTWASRHLIGQPGAEEAQRLVYEMMPQSLREADAYWVIGWHECSGSCSCSAGLAWTGVHHLPGTVLVDITFARDWWQQATDQARRGVVDHELRHLKLGEDGRLDLQAEDVQIILFSETLRRYGWEALSRYTREKIAELLDLMVEVAEVHGWPEELTTCKRCRVG